MFVNRNSRAPYVTIASGGTASSALKFGDYAFGIFYIPSAFTGATVTFQTSYDGTTYTTLRDSSNADISYTVTASKSYAFPDEASGASYIKIVSASAEGADRTIYCNVKG